MSGQTSPCGTGWYTSDVSLSWTWSPNDGANPTSGCLSHSYAQDTSTTVSCAITGPSGTASTSQAIHVEISSPTASASLGRAPDANGWYNHPVAAAMSGSSFSGIASCTGATYSGPDATSVTVSGTCTDNAGKTASATSPAFKYEASTPTITVGLFRSADSGGWYNHTLAATVSGSSFSGVASCTGSSYSGPDATNATVSGSCTDNAGKTVNGTSPAFKYEASTPAVSVGLSRSPDSNGWYNRAVTATASGSSFSGIASCTPASTYSGPDATNATVSGSCTDNAGKTASATSPAFKYEASTPTASASLARAPDANGWYNHPVAAAMSGSSFSGIASCTGATYSGPDTTSVTVSGTCTDNAGKTASATSPAFKYEASTPTITVGLSRSADSGGWYNHTLAATVSGSSFSGVASCTGSSYSGPDATNATVSGSCTDNAGKTVNGTSPAFKYEASTPAVSVGLSRSPDSNGWYTHPVAATVNGTSFSGIASCTGSTYSGPDSLEATVTGSCTDNAGKTASAASAPFRYDASGPIVSVAPSRGADSNGWYTRPVTATVTGNSVSGIASCTGGTYSGPDATSATVSGTCTDNAGKTASATSPAFKYEASTPTITVGLSRSADSGGWYNHPVTAKVSGSSFSGIASCSPSTYSGPDATNTTVSGSCTDNAGKTASATSHPFRYEASTPSVSVGLSRPPDSNGWYNHPVTAEAIGSSFSGIASCTPGTYSGPDAINATVSASCTDNAGKTASAATDAFRYDGSPPVRNLTADAGDGVVVLHWAIAAIDPLTSLEVTRTPGAHGAPTSVVYRARGTAYDDRHVRNRVRYRYTLLATDLAGNTARRSLVVTPGPRLLVPSQNTLVSRPPVLRWTPVRRASYYNVQLYWGNRKVLSTWPDGARLQLASTWSFGGRRYRLRPGKYRWYVWPGFGRRAAARYGRLIGSRTFRVARYALTPAVSRLPV